MNILNKNLLALLALFIVIVSIPITIYLVQKQQIFKGKAIVKSKLGIQTSWERVQGDAVMNFIDVAKPKVVKLLGGFNRAAEIKQKSPQTTIIGRLGDGNYDEKNIYDAFVVPGYNPELKAGEWVNSKRAIISSNSSVDCWEGPNEPVFSNDHGIEAMNWYNRFEKKRVEILSAMDRRACIGNFSVGTPELNLWQYFLGAIRAVKASNGYLGLHEYSAPNMSCLFGVGGPSDEGWLTGRYRKVHNGVLAPNNLGDTRIIFTETGIDRGVCDHSECDCTKRPNNQDNGWRSYNNGNAAVYLNELKWYDSILQQDDYVVGAAIFIFGRSDWDTFEIYPELVGADGRSGPLTSYIRGGPVPSPTPTPSPTPSGCPQVVTFARNPLNGNCRQFPSPCRVPQNWEAVSSCKGPAIF